MKQLVLSLFALAASSVVLAANSANLGGYYSSDEAKPKMGFAATAATMAYRPTDIAFVNATSETVYVTYANGAITKPIYSEQIFHIWHDSYSGDSYVQVQSASGFNYLNSNVCHQSVIGIFNGGRINVDTKSC